MSQNEENNEQLTLEDLKTKIHSILEAHNEHEDKKLTQKDMQDTFVSFGFAETLFESLSWSSWPC